MDNRGKDDPVSASTVTSSDKGQDSRRWWVLAAVSLAAFMTYLDNNIVNVAIPTIQHSLHLSVSGLEWVVSSYLLTVAGLLLVGGRLADVFGRRRLFLAGMAVFTLSSLAGALALAAGPALGGLISQHLHWGWIFLINVPVGVITFVIAIFYVTESRAESAARQLDLPGLVTSALALFALTYALI